MYLYQPYLDARGFGIMETGFVFAGVYLVAMFVAQKGCYLRKIFGEEFLLWSMLAVLALTFVVLNHFAGPALLVVLAIQAGTKGLYSPLVKPILNREIQNSARRATMLSVESIARRLAMGVFSLIAGYYGASSALYLCGAFAFLGLIALASLRPWMSVAPAETQSVGHAASHPAKAVPLSSID